MVEVVVGSLEVVEVGVAVGPVEVVGPEDGAVCYA